MKYVNSISRLVSVNNVLPAYITQLSRERVREMTRSKQKKNTNLFFKLSPDLEIDSRSKSGVTE